MNNTVDRACSKTRLVLNQAPGKTGKSPVFPLNSRRLFQKLKFWNSLDMKKVDLMLLALALTLLAAGLIFFRLAKKAPLTQQNDTTGNTALVFTQWWEDELEEGTLLALAEEFEALHPGVTVQLDNRPYAEILKGLRSAGESPLGSDIVGLDPFWLGELVRQDIL